MSVIKFSMLAILLSLLILPAGCKGCQTDAECDESSADGGGY
jgi:hypothetical protein